MTRSLIFLLLVLVCQSSSVAEPLMVTHLSPASKDSLGRLKLLERLETGAKISIPEGDEAVLTSLKTGTRYRLIGPSSFKVAETGVSQIDGNRSQLKVESGRKTSLNKPKDISSTLGGKLVRHVDFYIETAGSVSRPVLAWVHDNEAVGAEVRLQVLGETVFEQTVEKVSFVEVPLKPGQPTTLTVTLLTSGGVDPLGEENQPRRGESATTTVVLLDKKLSQPLLQKAQSALKTFQRNPHDATDLLISITHLVDQELYYDAWKLLEGPATESLFRDLRARLLGVIRSQQTPDKGSLIQ